MIRLIGIDVDGTLLDSRGHLPDANRDAIHEAVAAGIHVALVTGRSYPFARPVADTLPDARHAHRQQRRRGASDGRHHARAAAARPRASPATCSRRRGRIATHAALIFDRDEADQIVFETMDWEHPGRKAYWPRNQPLIGQIGAARGRARRGSRSR